VQTDAPPPTAFHKDWGVPVDDCMQPQWQHAYMLGSCTHLKPLQLRCGCGLCLQHWSSGDQNINRMNDKQAKAAKSRHSVRRCRGRESKLVSKANDMKT
jgi:hypothetical protein